ncbi:unnamed protein product [Ectocarpus sp. CCAP 1310/34]|nr:unnamed protein product [Ectocarpus sp. CCAP 1310/34]
MAMKTIPERGYKRAFWLTNKRRALGMKLKTIDDEEKARLKKADERKEKQHRPREEVEVEERREREEPEEQEQQQ